MFHHKSFTYITRFAHKASKSLDSLSLNARMIIRRYAN